VPQSIWTHSVKFYYHIRYIVEILVADAPTSRASSPFRVMALDCGYLGRLWPHPPACTHSWPRSKAAQLNVGSKAYGSFQLMYMSHNGDNAANEGQLQMSNGGQREDKAILALTTSLSGWVLTHKCQTWQCDQNLHGPLLRAILLMTIKVSVWAMAANGGKSDRKSTKVSYSTNMICLGQCTMVIMTL